MSSHTHRDGSRTERTDHGDGTGIYRRWDEQGVLIEETQLTDLPTPEEPEPTVEETLAALLEALQ